MGSGGKDKKGSDPSLDTTFCKVLTFRTMFKFYIVVKKKKSISKDRGTYMAYKQKQMSLTVFQSNNTITLTGRLKNKPNQLLITVPSTFILSMKTKRAQTILKFYLKVCFCSDIG